MNKEQHIQRRQARRMEEKRQSCSMFQLMAAIDQCDADSFQRIGAEDRTNRR